MESLKYHESPKVGREERWERRWGRDPRKALEKNRENRLLSSTFLQKMEIDFLNILEHLYIFYIYVGSIYMCLWMVCVCVCVWNDYGIISHPLPSRYRTVCQILRVPKKLNSGYLQGLGVCVWGWGGCYFHYYLLLYCRNIFAICIYSFK